MATGQEIPFLVEMDTNPKRKRGSGRLQSPGSGPFALDFAVLLCATEMVLPFSEMDTNPKRQRVRYAPPSLALRVSMGCFNLSRER